MLVLVLVRNLLFKFVSVLGNVSVFFYMRNVSVSVLGNVSVSVSEKFVV